MLRRKAHSVASPRQVADSLHRLRHDKRVAASVVHLPCAKALAIKHKSVHRRHRCTDDKHLVVEPHLLCVLPHAFLQHFFVSAPLAVVPSSLGFRSSALAPFVPPTEQKCTKNPNADEQTPRSSPSNCCKDEGPQRGSSSPIRPGKSMRSWSPRFKSHSRLSIFLWWCRT